MKSGKSHKTCLTKHTQSISHHIMPLVINTLEGRPTDTDTQTHRHTDTQTHTHTQTQTHTHIY